MPRRKGFISPYCFFVSEQLPELQRRSLPVACVIDAIPYCSQAWEACNLAVPVPACPTTKMPCVTFPDASVMSWENDQAVLVDIFYFLNIYSHGKLPSHCEQRFLPCEIGCVKYSLRDGIMADFHHFIEPEVPPRGFRYHCQAASDATHKIPVSGFHLPRTCYADVLWELLEFVHPARGVWPRFYCRSNDRFRISWCLNRMASITGIESHLELLDVEDLVIELHQKKYQKEPSKTWVCRELDAFLWDFSSNTRCKWHEENDILCCALASCKKIVYCISKSLASVYGVSLTAAHLPLQDLDSSESTNTKMVILDAGRFQNMKAEGPAYDRHFASPSWHQEFVSSNCDSPCGVKTCSLYGTSTMRGRGITRLLKSASDLTKPFSN
ncbi:protein maelstrom homolog isoform X2 [Pezoporus flaviventris]|uniref:protein maelstrom homolog isoform X2 n=1 Tax=Pezoporus flaviventris TaxID=889875 RepID=UPI002AB125A0|nr:protein maelstrom homolog isoform X2 [Pezoporus flaviventris]